jgi:hypothetical protein
LSNSFSSEEFEGFCSDYFPNVKKEFTLGMTYSQQISLLLQHCKNYNHWDNLLKWVKLERPIPYEEYIKEILIPDSSGKFSEDIEDRSTMWPQYIKQIFDKLDSLQQTLDAFRNEYSEQEYVKKSNENVLTQQTTADLFEDVTSPHSSQIINIVWLLSEYTRNYSLQLKIYYKQLSGLTGDKKRDGKKRPHKIFSNLSRGMKEYGLKLEETAPMYIENHSSFMDSFVREAARSLSNPDDSSSKKIAEILVTISVDYKPELVKAVNSIALQIHETEQIHLPSIIAGRKMRRDFAANREQLEDSLTQTKQVLEEALDHTVRAEAILQGFVDYNQHRDSS